MAEQQKIKKSPHVLLIPFPLQGHINPFIQFGKRLISKGVKTTLVTTIHTLNSTLNHSNTTTTSIEIQAISDGCDEGGFMSAGESYLETFKQVGSKSLADLIKKLQSEGTTIDAIIYDSMTEWVLDVAIEFGIDGGSFFTQACVVNSLYYHVHKGLISLPLGETVSVPGFPVLQRWETPLILQNHEQIQSPWSQMLFGQFANIDQARWVFTNSFYKLEEEVIEWTRKIWNLKVIGPTLPSMYLDKRLDDDKDNGFNLYKANHHECMNWLDDKPKESVVYVAFGSLVKHGPEQVEEITRALIDSDVNFLWVIKHKEEGKLPENLSEVIKTGKGLIVAWCKQLDVLAHESVGCFVTHCGFNSTLEAISLGVPVVAMPQFSDQTTNAKLLDEILGVGVRVKADKNGIVRRGNLASCIKMIMEEERGVIIRKNAVKWKDLAKVAVHEGGSSDNDIVEFVSELIKA